MLIKSDSKTIFNAFLYQMNAVLLNFTFIKESTLIGRNVS